LAIATNPEISVNRVMKRFIIIIGGKPISPNLLGQAISG